MISPEDPLLERTQIDGLSERKVEAWNTAGEYASFVRLLLDQRFPQLATDQKTELLDELFNFSYLKSLSNSGPEVNGQVIDLELARKTHAASLDLEGITMDAFRAVLSGKYSLYDVEGRTEHKAELLELDYQPPADPRIDDEFVVRSKNVADNERLDLEAQLVEIYLGDTKLSDSQRFIIDHLKDLDSEHFARKDLYALGYGKNGSANADSTLFARDIAKISKVLERLAGRPLILQEGSKRGTYYHLAAELKMVTGSEIRGPEALEAQEKLQTDEPHDKPIELVEDEEVELAPRRHRDLPILRKKPPVERKKMQTIDVVLPGYLRPEEIKPLDEVVANFGARNEDEVLNNRDLKLAIEGLMNNGKATDYRTRVVLAVRYGLYPPKFRQTAPFIRRGQETVRLDALMDSRGDDEPLIKRGQGLDVKSASELLTLQETAVLHTELDFLKKHKSDSKAVKEMAENIEFQLNRTAS